MYRHTLKFTSCSNIETTDIMKYAIDAILKISPDCLCNLLEVDKNFVPNMEKSKDVINKVSTIIQ